MRWSLIDLFAGSRRTALGASAFLVLGLSLGIETSASASTTLPARGTVEVAFSPADDPQAVLLGLIGSARASVYVQAYVFTSQPIAKALVAAKQRGVKVEVLADAKMNQRGGKALPRLLAAGVPLAFETRYAAAHNKVVIVDADDETGCSVATGSYNFTWSAQNRNAENLVVLRDNCKIARLYLENWKTHRADAVNVLSFPFRQP